MASAVWKYYKNVSTGSDSSKAKCLVCTGKETLITRGKTPKLYSTKPLWNHLKNCHPTVYSSLRQESKEDVPKGEEEDQDDGVGDSDVQQPTIEQLLKKKKKWESSNKQAQKITASICK
jgi:BED zinc finger